MDFLAPLWNLIIYDPILNALLFLYSIVQNYGLAIILFTVLLAVITMPLRIKSQQSMKEQQAKQARIAPRLEELKKKYKNDAQALQQAQMKLYQEEGLMNPFNMGCLLSFLPFPIFIAFYQIVTAVMGTAPEQLLLLSSHLYPFFPHAGALVPVNPYFLGLNLAANPVTAYGQFSPITIGIIVLAAGSTWVSQKLMTPATPTLDAQQAQMNSTMQLMMPVMFGFFVMSAPVGVSVYWITNGIMSIVQQLITGGTSSVRNLFRGPATPAKKAPPKRPKVHVEVTDGDEEDERPAQALSVASGTSDNQTAGVSNKPRAAVTKKGKKKRGNKS